MPSTDRIPTLKAYRKSELQGYTVEQLRQLVKTHNLHSTYIRKYYRMRKADLIDAFMKHHRPVNVETIPPPSPMRLESPTSRPSSPQQMKRSQTVPKGKDGKRKGKSSGSKPKLTSLDKALGIHKPLYPSGVAKGAKQQFEKRYGSITSGKSRPSTATIDTSNILSGKRVRKKKTPGADFV